MAAAAKKAADVAQMRDMAKQRVQVSAAEAAAVAAKHASTDRALKDEEDKEETQLKAIKVCGCMNFHCCYPKHTFTLYFCLVASTCTRFRLRVLMPWPRRKQSTQPRWMPWSSNRSS